MHSNVRQGARRVHSAEVKARVLAQCAEPGASVAAVALANGLNANLVRNWLMGRGLKRAGLACAGSMATGDGARAAPPVMRFVPVEMAGTSLGEEAGGGAGAQSPAPTSTPTSPIEVELRRGDANVAVRWPASQAAGCAAWLREVAGALLKG